MRVLVAMSIVAAMPAWATAQTARATLPANDTIIAMSWAGSEHKIRDDRRWHGSLLVAFSGGHYWTDHLKTELEGSWDSPGREEVYETLERQGGYTYSLSDYRARDVRVGVVQLYQFGRNDWVHPYIGAGVHLVRRTTSFERLPQSRVVYLPNRSVTAEIPAAREHTTTLFAQGVLKAGLKMYVTEKAFFNTEVRFGVRRDLDHVALRIGVGVDF